MPNQFDLTNEYVSSTYGRVVQIVSSSLYDGFGNLLYLNSGSSLYVREETTIVSQTSSFAYSLSQTPQSGSLVNIFYNGILLSQSSYSNVGPNYTLSSDLIVYENDILTFLYYANNPSGSGGGSSTSSSYSDYAATASYLLGSISSASYSLYAVSSSMAATASYYNGTVISSSHAVNADTSSYVRNAESASYYGGSVISSSYASSSSYSNSSSYAPAQPTSSYSLMALSASWAPPPGATISSSYSNNSSISDIAISASNAAIANTASYYNGAVESSSYSISSSRSEFSNNSNTASYYNGSVISSSYANTSSYSNQSLSSSYSTFVPYIQTIGSRISTEDSYITAGSKGYKHIGFNSSIVKARTITNETGSIDVNIKRNGTLLGNINITNSTGSYDNVLSGWTSQLNEDDLIEFYVSGSSTYITDITIFIDIKARQ